LADRKRGCIFSARGIAKNVWERAMKKKGRQEGLSAKLNANNFCQK
jgi:hypothetical protein